MFSTPELAERLATSVPRIHRAISRGLVAPAGRDKRGGLLFGQDAQTILLAKWGRVPPELLKTLSRPEAFVLGALACRPFGLRSIRAVATASGLSPTAAGRALVSLTNRALVERGPILAGGAQGHESAAHIICWRSGLWYKLAAQVGRVNLPAGTHGRPRPAGRLPAKFQRLFTDVNYNSLRTARHADFIIRRILASNDLQALAWMVGAFSSEAIAAAIASPRAVDPRTRPLARVLAAAR